MILVHDEDVNLTIAFLHQLIIHVAHKPTKETAAKLIAQLEKARRGYPGE